MSTGKFPDLMKLAEVVPLYKGKARDIEMNYHPISLITTMSKVMEKVIYTRVYTFLSKTGQICETQYGFRANHSCEHAVSQLIGTVLKNLENKKSTITVMLDLSKAFDTIEHAIMLYKLELYGVCGVCLDWFKSYLENRTMRVKCHVTSSDFEVKSEDYIVNYGMPQGLCLGPLIFLIFVNDMYLHLTDVESIQFADDITLLFGHKNQNYLQYCVERELTVLYDWFCANKLTLNVDKSVYLVFEQNQSQMSSWSLKLGNVEIPRCKVVKFLGTWIDDKLTWKTHISKLISKMKCGLGMLQRSNLHLTSIAKKSLYYGQVHSHLKYAIGVWGPMIDIKSLKKIASLQKQCALLVDTKLNKKVTCEMLRILTVQQLISL